MWAPSWFKPLMWKLRIERVDVEETDASESMIRLCTYCMFDYGAIREGKFRLRDSEWSWSFTSWILPMKSTNETVRIKCGDICMVQLFTRQDLNIFLKGLDQLATTQSGCSSGLFVITAHFEMTRWQESCYYSAWCFCNFLYYHWQIHCGKPTKKVYRQNFSINIYSIRTCFRLHMFKENQGLCTVVWKLTIIFNSQKSNINPRPHLVTIFNDVV